MTDASTPKPIAAVERAAERATKVHQRDGRTVEAIFPAGDLKDWNDVAQSLAKGVLQ